MKDLRSGPKTKSGRRVQLDNASHLATVALLVFFLPVFPLKTSAEACEAPWRLRVSEDWHDTSHVTPVILAKRFLMLDHTFLIKRFLRS